jgi:glutamate dehydrogenase
VLQTELLTAGAAPALATGVAVLRCQGDVLELVEMAVAKGVPAGAVVDAHVRLGEELRLPQLRDRLSEQAGDSSWVLAAKIALSDELDEYRVALTGAMVRTADADVDRFRARYDRATSRFAAARDIVASERDQSIPVLTVVVSELRRLVLATT